MANVRTKDLAAASIFSSGDSLVGNVSGDDTQSYLFSYAQVVSTSGAQTITGIKKFTGASGYNGCPVSFSSVDNFGITPYNSGGVDWMLFQTGSNHVAFGAFGSAGGKNGIGVKDGSFYAFSSGADPTVNWDIAIYRASAGVLEVNNGTAGVGGAINYPETASDADPAAPTTGATLYSKKTGGKHALFVRFPTGAVQQLALPPSSSIALFNYQNFI